MRLEGDERGTEWRVRLPVIAEIQAFLADSTFQAPHSCMACTFDNNLGLRSPSLHCPQGCFSVLPTMRPVGPHLV